MATTPCNPFPEGWGSGTWQSLSLVQVWILTVYAEDVHQSFLCPDVYDLKSAPLQRLPLPRPDKSVSLIHLYNTSCLLNCSAVAITLPLRSTLHSKPTYLSMCWGFAIEEPHHPMPVFLHGPCICLSFFIPLFILTRSVPGAMPDASNKQLMGTSLNNSLPLSSH